MIIYIPLQEVLSAANKKSVIVLFLENLKSTTGLSNSPPNNNCIGFPF